MLKEVPDFIYKDKRQVPINVQGIVDHLAGVNGSIMKAKKVNAFTNVQTVKTNCNLNQIR